MVHSGTWRLTHNIVQQTFAPVLASLLVVNRTVEVFLTSDLDAQVSAELHMQLWPLGNSAPHSWFSCNVTLKSETRLCHVAPLEDALTSAGCTPQTCFAYLKGTTNETPPRPVSAHVFFAPLRDVKLPQAHLTMNRPKRLSPNRASVLLSSDAVAVYAALESEVTGRFVPNAILLLPSTPVEVEFLGRSDFDLDDWFRGLRARSLCDTYREMSRPGTGEDLDLPLLMA